MRSPLSILLPLMALTIPAVRAVEGGPVSYYKDVRPVLQTACHGCHQPAKAKGSYVMTDFAALVKGGEDDGAAVVPGNPDGSALVVNIRPGKDGKCEMPKNGDPLKAAEVALIEEHFYVLSTGTWVTKRGV